MDEFAATGIKAPRNSRRELDDVTVSQTDETSVSREVTYLTFKEWKQEYWQSSSDITRLSWTSIMSFTPAEDLWRPSSRSWSTSNRVALFLILTRNQIRVCATRVEEEKILWGWVAVAYRARQWKSDVVSAPDRFAWYVNCHVSLLDSVRQRSLYFYFQMTDPVWQRSSRRFTTWSVEIHLSLHKSFWRVD